MIKKILYIHVFIECLAGFILLFNPHLLLNSNEPEIHELALAKMYGICAFFFGVISYIVSKNFTYNVQYKQIILCIICFHFVIGLYMYGMYHQHITSYIGAFVLHLGLAVLFLLIYLKEFQKFDIDGKSTE